MPRVSIILSVDEHRALCDLAVREWREPRDQAGWLIAEGLRQSRLLDDPTTAGEPADEAPAYTGRRQNEAPTHPSLENEGGAGAREVRYDRTR
jgi:hypothetical protein